MTGRPRAKPAGRRRVDGRPSGDGEATSADAAAEDEAYDVFLSYSHDTLDSVARPLVRGLEQRGLRVWWDQAEMGIGDTLRDKIRDGLLGAGHGVVIASRGYLDSGWGRTELGAMFLKKLPVFVILRGVDVETAKEKLPAVSETLMQRWDESSPESIMDRIADAVGGTRSGRKGGAPCRGAGGGGQGWKEALGRASRGSIDGIPSTIQGIALDRKDESDAVKRLLEGNKRVVVTGDKGSGKSVLLCRVYESLAASHNAAFVRADDFLGIKSLDELDRSIVPGHLFTDIARSAARDGADGAVIIIDSLDSIARDKKTMSIFRQLIRSVWGAGARTIVTVRSYDYHYSGSISSTDWGAEHRLGQLSRGQVERVMDALGSPPVSDEFAPLLANPLNLHIFALVAAGAEKKADLASIRHEIDLYDAHWHTYVEQGPSPVPVASLLYGAARTMARIRRMSVPRSGLGGGDAADLAQSANVLRPVRRTGRVAFFHQAYLDYVLSRAMLEEDPSIVGHLKSDDHNLFIRPALPLALAMAHSQSPRRFARIATEMLRSGLRHYWKMTATTALARLSGNPATDYGEIGRLLTERPMLQRHFLVEAAEQKNAFWLGAWGASFLAEWAADGKNPNGAFLVGYARAAASAASGDPGAQDLAFRMLRSVAESNLDGAAQRRAAEASAGISAEGRREWLVSASKHSRVKVRAGAAHILPGLLRTDADLVPEMFCNLYTHEETSTEKTVWADAGSMLFTGNPMQDNSMIKWGLEKEFPGMLRERPEAMLVAAIMTAERASPGPGRAGLVDDPPAMLRHEMAGPAHAGILSAVRKRLEECGDAEFDALMPLLAESRLGSFRSMLIDGMARRGRHLDMLAECLADPRVYELLSMRSAVRTAIRTALARLPDAQVSRILAAIMESNTPEEMLKSAEQSRESLREQLSASPTCGPPLGEQESAMIDALTRGEAPEVEAAHAERRSRGARALFLAEFPEDMLESGHVELVKACRSRGDACSHPPPQDIEFREIPGPAAPRQSPEDAVRAAIGGDHGREGKLSLLESISEYLDGPADALDAGLLARIEARLLECARDPDPDGGAPDEPGAAAIDYPCVRGLAALCLAKLVAVRGGSNVEDAFRELSKDPSNLVRGSVARGLALLPPGRDALARPILLDYSRDADPRVRFFLIEPFNELVRSSPDLASTVLENTLASGGPPMQETATYLLFLALARGNERTAALLEQVAGDVGDRLHDIRLGLPFALKAYLSSRTHRDAAFDLLRRLIEAGPNDVRAKAAFFALNGIDDDALHADPDYVERAMAHLELLASLFEQGIAGLDTAEHAVQFLEDHWRASPGTALSIVEAVAHGRAAPAHRPVLAECTARIVSGMIDHYSPGSGEWNRCLDALDVYAEAGWPEVLELLALMDRKD